MTTTLAPAKPRHATGSGRNKLVVLLTAIAAVFALAACHLVGSGSIVSANGKGKATFTFSINCPTSGPASGVLTYADIPAKVSLHGVVSGSSSSYNCGSVPTATVTISDTLDGAPIKPNVIGPGGFINGTYTPLKPGTGGTFSLTVIPGGTAQDSSGWFCIALYGGVYNGYTNAGWVDLGNIVSP
jgi:hypothetical protein